MKILFCRYPSCEEHDALKLEVDRLKMKLIEKEGECMEALASSKKSEAFVRKMELTVKQERMEMESTIERAKREARQSEDKALVLKADLEKRRRSSIQEKEDESFAKKEARFERNELEDKISELTTENGKLQDENENLRECLDEKDQEERSEVLQLRRELAKVQSYLQEEKEKEQINLSRIAQGSNDKVELEKAQSDLLLAKNEIQSLQRELKQNEDATIERKAMRQRLDDYPRLVSENDSLKRQNKLLIDTADNSALLKTKVDDLEVKLNKADIDARDGMLAKEQLHHYIGQIERWRQLSLELLNEEEKAMIDVQSIGVDVLRQKIAEFQRKEISDQVDIKTLEAKVAESDRLTTKLVSEAEKHDREHAKAKEDLNQQASLIKRFKRKLLLIVKERDSYKGVLDTYEKEITFTGTDFEKDRVQSLENVIVTYRETIESLENQLAKYQGVSHEAVLLESDVQKGSPVQSKQISEEESAKIRSELEKMENQLNTALAQKEALELELECRAIQGDYNPTDTKVLHFRNNPMQQATEEHSLRLSKLQGDNESLKTRIKLLEEGQSKDLTLLVGQKMEENVSSQEVQELKEQLKSKDIQKQRLLEAFSNTSKSFREVCCQLTGYRIDGLQNNQFRLTPTYAENPTDDNLLFRLEQGGELSMLDTPFSSQLTELIDLHLIRQNSIPVFLAAVIMDLFSRQTFETFQESQSETAPSQGPSHYPAQMESVAVLPGTIS